MKIVVDCVPEGANPLYDKDVETTAMVMSTDGNFARVDCGKTKVLVPLLDQNSETASVFTRELECLSDDPHVKIILCGGKMGMLLLFPPK